MLRIRCKECNHELESHSSKTRSCGCSNMTTIKGNKISAVDLNKVIIIESTKQIENLNFLTREDIAWQESRRQRKVKRLNFEIR